MNGDEQFVIDLLKDFNLNIAKLPRSDGKSPDFLAIHNCKRILIELKTKYDSRNFVESIERELSSSGTCLNINILQRSNTMSGIVKEAYEQLKESKNKYKADECYVFLLASEPYAHDKYEQFYHTLYGSKLIIPLGNNAPTARDCFYYEFSDFFRYSDIIDGALISNGSKMKCCLNNFSEAYKSIKDNVFVDIFKGKVVDPVQLEKEGKAYLLDSNIDRRDTESLNNYLIKKYGLEKLTQASFPSYTITSKTDL